MRGLRGGENGGVLLLILQRFFEKQRSLLPSGRSAYAEDFGVSRRLIRRRAPPSPRRGEGGQTAHMGSPSILPG